MSDLMPPKGSYLYEQMMHKLAEGSGRVTHPQLAEEPKPKASRPRVRHVAGKMNQTEAAFAEELELRKRCGEIIAWAFESVKFKIADDRCWFTTDFMVVESNTERGILFVDVKGGGPVEEDALVKIKVAATTYPMFRFAFATRAGGGWVWRSF